MEESNFCVIGFLQKPKDEDDFVKIRFQYFPTEIENAK